MDTINRHTTLWNTMSCQKESDRPLCTHVEIISNIIGENARYSTADMYARFVQKSDTYLYLKMVAVVALGGTMGRKEVLSTVSPMY